MCAVIITCITQILTTLITVGVTALVAYLTYSSQKKKSDASIKRLQEINQASSLELFRAYLASLVFFAPEINISLSRTRALTHISKMKLIEQYLSELSENELPDTFIKDFRYYRLKLAFQRIAIETYISDNENDSFLPSEMDTADTLSLINSIKCFISQNTKNPEE